MTNESLNKLKIAVNKFYLNKYEDQPSISDLEYDALAVEYTREGGNVYNLIEWDQDVTFEHAPVNKVKKEVCPDNNFCESINKWLNDTYQELNLESINYKYDGCGIMIIYNENGQLQKVLSSPDSDKSIDRTANFFNMVPHTIPAELGVKVIVGEVLCDANVYGELARNAANGMTNSKDMREKIEAEAFIRVYNIKFFDTDEFDGNRIRRALTAIPKIRRIRTRPVTRNANGEDIKSVREDLIFGKAENLTWDKVQNCKAIMAESLNVSFQVDGIVVYTQFENHAFKFYYTDSAITTVKNITWNRSGNGSISAVLELEPVTLNGKYIANVSSGGVLNILDRHMGIGSRIKVILANMTIPYILEVVDPSDEINWPTCECGHKFSIADVNGSVLKCPEPECSWRADNWTAEIARLAGGKSLKEYFSVNDDLMTADTTLILNTMQIGRWNPKAKYNQAVTPEVFKYSVSYESFGHILVNLIMDANYTLFHEWIKKCFYFSDLQLSEFEANCLGAFTAIRRALIFSKEV